MSTTIDLLSPRNKLAGWAHLPRLIGKIRLHQAGKLPADYQANYGKGFDGMWLKSSGVELKDLEEVVRTTTTDAEIEKWIVANVKKTPQEIEAFNQRLLNRGRNDDASDHLKKRKLETGVEAREDVQTFVDLIDVDEGRL